MIQDNPQRSTNPLEKISRTLGVEHVKMAKIHLERRYDIGTDSDPKKRNRD